MRGRDQLRARARVQVDELGEEELDAAVGDVLPDLLEALVSRARSTGSSVGSGARLYHAYSARFTGRDWTLATAQCVSIRGRPSQQHQLDRDLDLEPVVAPEVEVRELADPPQPLAKRVRVHIQRLRGRADVAAPAQELLEGLRSCALPLLVVGGEPTDRVDGRVPDAAVVRDPQQVLVGAELVVGDDVRLPAEHGGAGERVARLLEAIDEGRRVRADARERRSRRSPSSPWIDRSALDETASRRDASLARARGSQSSPR